MIRLLLLMPVFIGLIACSSGPDTRYLDSRALSNLEIPPDLTKATLNEKFVIPANISSGLSETVDDIPVLARVESIDLAGSEDFYWLEISGRVENLYKTIKNFWLKEGYLLEIDEPVIGIMQTEWLFKREGSGEQNQGFLVSLFGDGYLAEAQDQFRTRIDIDSATDNARIYISHRGTQYNNKGDAKRTEAEEQGNWSFRAPEPELEIEMLSRLMVYLGLNRAEVDQRVATAKLFAPRASMHTDTGENETYILVRSIKELTWNRLLHELDRLDFEIVSTNPSKGLSGDGVVLVKTLYEIEQKKSGFLSIFSSDEIQRVNKQVALVVSEKSHDVTRIGIETPDGEVDDSIEAIEFLTMLYEHIR